MLTRKAKDVQHYKMLIALLWCMAVWFVVFQSLAGGKLLQSNPHNSYLVQIENWFNGSVKIQNGSHYTWLELAIYHGDYYLSFPPVPSLIMIPWFLVFGITAPSNLIIAIHCMITAAGVYLFFKRLENSPMVCCFWTLFVVAGSNCVWLSSDGGVWMQAQILNLCFVIWGLYFYIGQNYIPAFALLSLAVGCRPFTALLGGILLAPVIFRLLRRKNLLSLVKMSILPVLIFCAMGAYNFARFGNPLEFGHNYLPEFVNAPEGQFSLSYIWPNLLNILRPITINSRLELNFPVIQGFCFFVANPIFAFWFWRMAKSAASKSFGWQDGVLFAGFVVALLMTCAHRTMGAWQFGARYTVDLIPYALLFFARKRRSANVGIGSWTLCVSGVLLNVYGAIYMLTAWETIVGYQG